MDKDACRHCGIINVDFHAHHIKGWKDYEELRLELSNLLTLCVPCHMIVHWGKREKN